MRAIDWDGEGIYTFQQLDELEAFANKIYGGEKFGFTYAAGGHIIVAEVVKPARATYPEPVVHFLQYDEATLPIFGITGSVMGSITDCDNPYTIAHHQILPGNELAVLHVSGDILTIPAPSEPIYYHPNPSEI